MVVGADTGSQLVSILTDFGASVTMIEASPDVVTALCTCGATRRATAVHALLWGTTSFLLPGSRRTFGRVAKRSLPGGLPPTPAHSPATAACDDANRVVGSAHRSANSPAVVPGEVEVFPIVVMEHRGYPTVRARSPGGVGERRASMGRS